MFFDWGYYARFRHIAQLEILLPETFTNYGPYQVAWTVKWLRYLMEEKTDKIC